MHIDIRLLFRKGSIRVQKRYSQGFILVSGKLMHPAILARVVGVVLVAEAWEVQGNIIVCYILEDHGIL